MSLSTVLRLASSSLYLDIYKQNAMNKPSKDLIPATDFDTLRLQQALNDVPFLGPLFAPYCSVVAAHPVPDLNERGQRDAEGWTVVYEAVVQESECSSPHSIPPHERSSVVGLGKRHRKRLRAEGKA